MGKAPVEQLVSARRQGARMHAHDERRRRIDKLQELERKHRHIHMLPFEGVEESYERLGYGGEHREVAGEEQHLVFQPQTGDQLYHVFLVQQSKKDIHSHVWLGQGVRWRSHYVDVLVAQGVLHLDSPLDLPVNTLKNQC